MERQTIIFISLLLFVGFMAFTHHRLQMLERNEAKKNGEGEERNGIISAAAKLLFSLSWSPSTSSSITKPHQNPNQSTRLPKYTPNNPLTLNLSSCGDSYSDGHRLINCCPATDDASQTIIDFKFPETSYRKRIRRPTHRLDEDYIKKYKKAVEMIKNLDKNHPHNFWRQANIHCLYCTGGYKQTNSSILFNIHRSWLFFPFHRAMIYFHERILGKYIGDDNFSLNYWQWDHPTAMMIPEMYLNGSLFEEWRDSFHLPPKIVDHNFIDTESGLDSDEQIQYNLAFMYHQMISGAKKTELFMGCRLSAGEDGFCDGPGTIEDAPHNTLHTWVGSPLNPERENMGSFYSAGRDPIFYAHHSNIDRLWTVWQKMNPDKLPEFNDHAWLDTEFFFYDENLQLVRVRVRDMLDHTKLGYDYEETANPWMNAKPEPAVKPKVAKQMLADMIANDNTVIKMPCHNTSDRELKPMITTTFTLDNTVRTLVHRPRKHKVFNDDEEEVLVVYGIDSKGERTKFDVFVNLVDESKATPSVSEFAGTYVSLPHGRASTNMKNNNMKSHLKLGISELLHDLEAENDDNILVALVPRIVNKNATSITTVDGIRIEYMV